MDQKERAREEYILKELTKNARVLNAGNWICIGLIVLYVVIIVYRMLNGIDLPKITYKTVMKFLWTAILYFYVRSMAVQYKTAVRETERAMNDPSFQGYSEKTKTVRNNARKAATSKGMIGAIFFFLGLFFLAGDVLILWTAKDDLRQLEFIIVVFCFGFLAAGLAMMAYGVSEWRSGPEGKRLFGNKDDKE